MRGPGPGWAAWDAVLRDGPPRGVLAPARGCAWARSSCPCCGRIRATVPLEPSDTGTGINNVSVVFLGEANGRRFLLMGDVEQGIDPTLLARGLPRVDVLKVAHHGSATATTQAFVDAVRPRVAVASAGAGNPYGHPARSTLGRLRASGARVYRTDQDGSVEVDLRHEGVAVTATGPSRSATLAGTARLAADRTRLDAPTGGAGRECDRWSATAVRDPDPGRLARVGGPGAARDDACACRARVRPPTIHRLRGTHWIRSCP